MLTKSARVFSVNREELEVARKQYLPFAEKGVSPNYFLDYEEDYPLLAEISPLFHILIPHHIKNANLLEVKGLIERIANDWSEELKSLQQSTARTKEELSAEYRLQLTRSMEEVLAKFDSSLNLTENVLLLLRQAQNPQDLRNKLKKITKEIEIKLRDRNIKGTIRDLPRGASVNGVRVPGNLDEFKSLLQREEVAKPIIDFFEVYLNQENITGDNFLEKQMTLFGEAKKIGPYSGNISNNMKVDITTFKDKPKEAVLTYVKTIRNLSYLQGPDTFDLPNETQAKCFSQIKIRLDEQSQIQVDLLDSYLEIYNPAIRDQFIDYKVDKAKLKIRQKKPLMANDKLAVDHYLHKFLKPNGSLDKQQLNTVDSDSLFLLMWNNVWDAEDLLRRMKLDHALYKDFFLRSSQDIEADIRLIAEKHHYYENVTGASDYLLELLQLIRSENFDAIKEKLTEESNRQLMLLCLYSVNDPNYISKLIKHSNIKNLLTPSLLTHFALQDQSIAETLLKPTFWERTKFTARSLLGRALAKIKIEWSARVLSYEKLPYTHFRNEDASPYLRQIVQRYPSFWSTLFGPLKKGLRNPFKFYPNYRYQLNAADIKQLRDLKNPRTPSYLAALNATNRDLLMMQKINVNSPYDLKQRVEYIIENSSITLDSLHNQEGIWKELHGKLEGQRAFLDDSDLSALYESKLNLGYKRTDLNLLQATEDVWASISPRRTTWSKIPQEKKKLAEDTVIKVIGNKLFNFAKSPLKAQAGLNLPSYILFAEIYITQPIKDAFKKESFPPERLRLFQKRLLENPDTFNALFNEPKLTPKYINEYIKKSVSYLMDNALNDEHDAKAINEEKKTALQQLLINLLKLQPFISALEVSRSLNLAVRSLLDSKVIKELVEEDHHLNKLKKKLPPAPPYTKAEAHRRLQVLYDNEQFREMLLSIPFIEEFLAPLLVNARFKKTMREQEDLYFFDISWQNIKAENDDNKLLELIALLPKDKFTEWLESKEEEADFLLEKILKDPSFYAQFAQLRLEKVQGDLIRRAKTVLTNSGEIDFTKLKIMIFNCKELGDRYLDTIKSDRSPSRSAVISNFESFLNALEPIELLLLIAKYPQLMDKIEEVGLIPTTFNEKVDLIPTPLQVKIKNALEQGSLVINNSGLLPIINTNHYIEKTVTDLDKATNKAMLDLEYRADYLRLTDPTKSSALNVANYFVCRLVENYTNIELVLSLLENRDVLSLLLAGAVQDRWVPILLGDIAKSLAKLSSGDQGIEATHLTLFINTILEKAILDPQFLQAINSSNLLNRYINSVAEPELIAKFLMLKTVDIGLWQEGLDKVFELKSFPQLLPHLVKYPNFGRWLIDSKREQQRLRLFSNKDTAAILSGKIEEILEKREYEHINLLDWLLSQYNEKGHHIEPLLRDILNNNDQARYNFIKYGVDKVDKMLDVAIMELDATNESKLAEDILSEPYLNYILERSTADGILKLLAVLRRKGDKSKEKFIAERLMAIIARNEDVCLRLMESAELAKYCFRFGIEKNHNAGKAFFARIFSLRNIPDTILQLPFNNILSLFIGIDSKDRQRIEVQDVEGFTRYFLTLLRLRDRYAEAHSILEDLLSDETIFSSMFTANPELVHELILKLFEMIHLQSEPEASAEDRQQANYIKQQLGKLASTPKFYSLLKDLVKRVDPNKAIDLILLADGVTFPVTDVEATSEQDATETSVIFNFEELLQGVTLDYFYFEADEQKLLALFSLKPQLIDDYMAKAGANDRPSLVQAIRKQWCAQNLPAGNNLISFLTKHGDAEYLLTLLSADPAVHHAWVQAIIGAPRLLFVPIEDEQSSLRPAYVRYILRKGTAEELDAIIRAVDALGEEVNPLIEDIYRLLVLAKDSQDYDEELHNKIIALFVEPEANLNLIAMLLDNLNTKQLVELLVDKKNLKLNQAFQSFMKARPEDVRHKFEATEETINDFNYYFLLSEQRLTIYLLLNEVLPDSSLARRIDRELDENNVSAITTLAQANSVQLATIFNYEGLGVLENRKMVRPMTKIMFSNPVYLKYMFETLPRIADDRLVFCEEVQRELETSSKNGNMELVEAYSSNFDKSKRPLKFVGGCEKPVSDQVRLAYLVIQRLMLNKRLVSEAGDEAFFYFHKYIQLVNQMVADFDKEGRLLFRETATPVPLEYAVSFFEALGVFFYTNRRHIVDLINKKPKLCEALIDTVKIHADGNATYAYEGTTSELTMYYLHMVLYAYCKTPARMNNPPAGLLETFVNSIDYKNGQIYFACPGDCVPPKIYLDAVYRGIEELALSSKRITDTKKLRMICHLPNFLKNRGEDDDRLEALGELLLNNKDLCLSFMDSVYVDAHHIVRFKDTEGEVPEDYLEMVYKAIRQQSNNSIEGLLNTKCNFANLFALVEQMHDRDEVFLDFNNKHSEVLLEYANEAIAQTPKHKVPEDFALLMRLLAKAPHITSPSNRTHPMAPIKVLVRNEKFCQIFSLATYTDRTGALIFKDFHGEKKVEVPSELLNVRKSVTFQVERRSPQMESASQSSAPSQEEVAPDEKKEEKKSKYLRWQHHGIGGKYPMFVDSYNFQTTGANVQRNSNTYSSRLPTTSSPVSEKQEPKKSPKRSMWKADDDFYDPIFDSQAEDVDSVPISSNA